MNRTIINVLNRYKVTIKSSWCFRTSENEFEEDSFTRDFFLSGRELLKDISKMLLDKNLYDLSINANSIIFSRYYARTGEYFDVEYTFERVNKVVMLLCGRSSNELLKENKKND